MSTIETSAPSYDGNRLVSKPDAARYLGKSARTIEQYVTDGRLPAQYITGAHGLQAKFYHSDLIRLKEVLDTPTVRAVSSSSNGPSPPPADPTAVARITEFESGARLMGQLLKGRYEPPAPKRWMTLDQAADYSGLPTAVLRRAVRKKTLAAIRHLSRKDGSTFYVTRDAVDKMWP